MELVEELPLGLWVVKWIDRFHFGSESACLDIAFQKMPEKSVGSSLTFDQKRIGELLGTVPQRTNSPTSRAPIIPSPEPGGFVRRPMHAASLPFIRIGELFEGRSPVAELPTVGRKIVLTEKTVLRSLATSDRIDAPSGWSIGSPFKVLNRFEYVLGGIDGIHRSQCMVFAYEGTEYILPRIVVFRTFYGLSSPMINALCNGPWSRKASELISFRKYKSGIRTGVDVESGDWNIVLQPGLSSEMAPILAHLWFDDFARKKTEAMHTEALQEKQGTWGFHGRSWFANASIPYEFGASFEMQVQGFPLRPYQPSQPQLCPKRFLITAITATTWPHIDRTIHWEYHLSAAKGELQRPADDDREFSVGRPPVEGDPDSLVAPNSDPDANAAPNLFQAAPFEFINKPKLLRQQKKESQQFSKSQSTIQEAPSLVVATGNATYSDVVPAPGDAQTQVRGQLAQFDMLLEALKELLKSKKIEGFCPISPTKRGVKVHRGDLPCWSLLKEADRPPRMLPKRGWEVIHLREDRDSGAKPSRHERCALVLSVSIAKRQLLLIEIEPRSNKSTFRLFALEYAGYLDEQRLEQTLGRIRDREGVIADSDLGSTFGELTGNKVVAFDHRYIYPDENKYLPANGIRAESLMKGFMKCM